MCKTEAGKALVAKGAILLELRKELVAENYPHVSAVLLKVHNEESGYFLSFFLLFLFLFRNLFLLIAFFCFVS